MKEQFHSPRGEKIKVNKPATRQRRFKRSNGRFNGSKLFKVAQGPRSTNKVGPEMGLNRTSSSITERKRRRTGESTKSSFKGIDPLKEREKTRLGMLKLISFWMWVSLFSINVSGFKSLRTEIVRV